MSQSARGNDATLEPYLDMIFKLGACLCAVDEKRIYRGLADEALAMLEAVNFSTLRTKCATCHEHHAPGTPHPDEGVE